MKRLPVVIAIAVVFATALLVTSVAATATICPDGSKGNCAPSGSHYNLNIVGMKNIIKNIPTNLDNGHVIFVKLGTKNSAYVTTRIWLNESPIFQVIDKWGIDGDATFGLPSNEIVVNGEVQESGLYTVWVRALGTPGGKANMTTCVIDEFGDEYCPTGQTVELNAHQSANGRNKFVDVTKELTTVCFGTNTCYDLFDEGFLAYFWKYENAGLKLAQLRFYPKNP